MTEVETVATSTITGAALHAFIESRREPGERLYGVVDAAQDKELAFAGARQFGWKLQWLFSEDTSEQMVEVAPYLVPITFESNYPFRESDYLDLWAERLGNNAGILLLTGVGPDEMRNHLHSIFNLNERGEDYYFRFYDPRVLRTVVPVCTGDNVAQYFGPTTAMLVESEKPGHMYACRPGKFKVKVTEQSLVDPPNNETMKGDR